MAPGQPASRREARDAPALDVHKQRGAFETKCLQFKDKTAQACAYLFPADVVPDRQLTVALWMRSADVGGGARDKQQATQTRGRGTVLSYAAYCRCAFNLRWVLGPSTWQGAPCLQPQASSPCCLCGAVREEAVHCALFLVSPDDPLSQREREGPSSMFGCQQRQETALLS